MYFYSASASGFFLSGISSELPDDANEVSEAEYRLLFAGQEKGQRIVADAKGRPKLADPLPPSLEQQAAAERLWRDQRLSETDGVVTRHRDETEDGSETTLTSAQYTELQAYRRALRNWPEAVEFPLLEHRPPVPEWLSTLIQ